MENTNLKQKGIFKSKYCELRNDDVYVLEKIFLKTNKYSCSYENISSDKVESVISSKIKLWTMIILIVLSLFILIESVTVGKNINGAIFYGIFAVIVGVTYFITREKVIIFKAIPLDIILYQNKPSFQEVQSFCNSLMKNKTEYLEKYFIESVCNESKISELEKLFELKKNKVITEDEFNKLKGEIINKNFEDNYYSSN